MLWIMLSSLSPSQGCWSFCFLCSFLQLKGLRFIESSDFYYNNYTETTLFKITRNFSTVKSNAHFLHLTKLLSRFSLSSFLLKPFQKFCLFVFFGMLSPVFLISHWYLLSSIFVSNPSDQHLNVGII